ncbi:MAG: LysR family transcriptional regulator, transcriptional activator of the cysJI operon [Chloroflexota bacterium]|nr:LysR family transcriptional regulator, transcriptional activator of the cysJI operon [Chloroflexota bacterium]
MARIDQLLSYCTVVELKSFSLAAERLGLTQPTISLQIKALESEFGSVLLHRESHHILPTSEGQIVYDNSLKILALYEKTRQAVYHKRSDFSGTLTIGASSGPADYPIPLLLGKFKSEHPECAINLQVGDSSEIIDKVFKQSLELGFVGTRRRDGNLYFEPYLEDKLVLVAAKGHPIAEKKRISFEELVKVPLIVQQPGSGITINLQDALSAGGLNYSDLNILMELGLQDSVKSAVAAGYGAAIISSLGTKKEIESGMLQEIEVEGLDLYRQIFICYNRMLPLTNITKEFLAFAIRNKDL